MKTGIELIAEERQHQIQKGYDLAHDKEHNGRELSMVASTIISPDQESAPWIGSFPADWEEDAAWKLVNKPYKERLIIAGALIAAELDRLLATKTED